VNSHGNGKVKSLFTRMGMGIIEWEWEEMGINCTCKFPRVLYKFSIRHLRQANKSSLSPVVHWRSAIPVCPLVRVHQKNKS